MLGFVLVGPLALVVWVAAGGLFGPKDQANEVSEDDDYGFVIRHDRSPVKPAEDPRKARDLALSTDVSVP